MIVTRIQRYHFDPLRILFCGADEFSIFSLQKLHELQTARPECISRIDVVCRRDKPVGRRRQQMRAVPIKSTAQSLGLSLHQIDTFTGWTPPPTDLVVTVSFGLLVPSRILRAARFGGVNIHPSLLPDLRGPAPIQHALLQNRKTTGVTLQTMHPTQFDRGALLAQRRVDVPEDATMDRMLHTLGHVGADMLATAIEDGVVIDQDPFVNQHAATDPTELSHAPKITPQDREVTDWTNITAEELLRRDRVLGKLWDEQRIYATCCSSPTNKRITFHGGWKEMDLTAVVVEKRVAWKEGEAGGVVVVRIPGVKGLWFGVELRTGGMLVVPAEATIEGEKKGQGLRVLIDNIRKRV